MSYRNDQPYSYGPPPGQQGGQGQPLYNSNNYGPPPPHQQNYSGGPPPPPRADYQGQRFQPGPGAGGGGGRSPPRGGGYGGPPPPQSRGREFAAPVDQGWGSRQRRRSASPGYDRGGAPGRDGPPGGYGGGYGGPPPDRGGYGAPPPAAGGGDRGEYNSRANGPRELSVLDPGRGRRRIPRDEGDTGLTEEEHARIVEERKRKEQPCRTLFIRNVKYGVTADMVRERFDRIGDVRTCFDMLEKRGMLFITYFDIRAAMMAKDQLQGSMINGRPIDVHFSLPRDADLAKRCDREKGQGTLALTVPGARGPIEDRELMDRFGAFGEVHSVAPDPTRPEQRLIQFFDSRGSERAYDSLNDSPLAGGRMDLRFMWDPPPSLLPRMPPREQQRDQYGYGPPPGQAAAPAVPYAGNYGAPPPPPPAPYGGASPYGAPPAAAAGGYGAPAAGGAAEEDRLAQALKVQKLLESLGKGSVPPPSAPPTATAPYAGGSYGAPPSGSYGAPPPQVGGYASPHAPQPQGQGYGASPLPPSVASPPQPAAPALPAALLALLGKSGAGAGAGGASPQGSGGGTPPPPPPRAQAPAAAAGGEITAAASAPAAPQQVQELLSLLAQQQKQQDGKQ